MEELISLIESFKEFKNIRNINRESLMYVLDSVIRTVLHKKYGNTDNINIIVNIDKGTLEVWRNRIIVNKVVDTNKEISFEDAIKIEPDFELGEEFSDEIKLSDFSRRDILNLKTILVSKIKELESSDIYKKYKNMIGEIISGEVVQISKYEIILVDSDNTELVLPREEAMPNDFFKKGYSTRALVMDVQIKGNLAEILLSRSCPEFVEKLLENEVSHISDGLITIVDSIRLPGERTKIFVETYDERVDPVGICVGAGGSNIRQIMRELNGENIDIISYTENKELLIRRIFNPAKISRVEFGKTIDVYVNQDQIGIAIGKGRSNIIIASEFFEKEVNIYVA